MAAITENVFKAQTYWLAEVCTEKLGCSSTRAKRKSSEEKEWKGRNDVNS